MFSKLKSQWHIAPSMEQNKRSQVCSPKIGVWILVLFLPDCRTWGRSVNLSLLKMWVLWTEKRTLEILWQLQGCVPSRKEDGTDYLLHKAQLRRYFWYWVDTHCVMKLVIRTHGSFTESLRLLPSCYSLGWSWLGVTFYQFTCHIWTPNQELWAI